MTSSKPCLPVYQLARSLAAAILLLGIAPALPAAPTATVPFIDGLVGVTAVASPRGDYESLTTISGSGAAGYVITLSGELPADDGSGLDSTSIARRVSAADRRGSHILRPYFGTLDPPAMPGTTPGLSFDMLQQLRSTGQTQVTYREANPGFFGLGQDEDFAGVLRREQGAPSLTVLVNGKATALPVLRCRATLRSEEGETQEMELVVLDQPDNPMVLMFRLGENRGRTLRIEFPTPAGQVDAIESALAAREPALVYSLYFSFGRAELRPESGPTLAKLAAILAAHPDWKLSIGGHTDNVGGDAANLALSAARAATVRNALMQRHHIDGARLSTTGFGMRAPIEANDTPEHRALNRRVELRRQ